MPELPQPHEGIAGTDREDDLLSLDDAAVGRRQIMAGIAHCLHRATMVGHPAPIVAKMWARMSAPRPGDLVMEWSTFWRARRGDVDSLLKGFGILIAERVEWSETDEQWMQLVAADPILQDQRTTEKAIYIQYGPAAADICRWVNAQVFAVLHDPAEIEQ